MQEGCAEGARFSDGRVDEMMGSIEAHLSKLDGAEALMTRDMLRTFCWYTVKVDDLMDALEAEGIIIDTPGGPRANPANTVLHQYSQRKADYYQKCLRSLSHAGAEAVDRLAEFCSGARG